MRRREIRPIVYNADGSVQKVLRPSRFDDRPLPGQFSYGDYWENRYLYATDFERFVLDYPFPCLFVMFAFWAGLGSVMLYVLYPDFEDDTYDRTMAIMGGADRGQLTNLGILRDVDVNMGNQFRFWGAAPTQWYGKDYKGAPDVGKISGGY